MGAKLHVGAGRPAGCAPRSTAHPHALQRCGAEVRSAQTLLSCCTSLTTITMPMGAILEVSIAQGPAGGSDGRRYKAVLQSPREAP